MIAKISRPVYYQLMDMVVQNSNGDMGIWSAEEFLVLQWSLILFTLKKIVKCFLLKQKLSKNYDYTKDI